MNLFQKFLLKQITRVVPNDYLLGMYQYVGANAAQWIDANNESYISEGFEKNADVFSIVQYIYKRASTVPWKLYEYNSKGEMKEIKEHPLIDLIERPNPMMGQSFFIQTLLCYKLILGNSYIYIPWLENGVNAGKTREMWILPSPRIEIVSNGYLNPVDHYRFSGSTSPKFDPKEVIHIKTVSMDYSNGASFYGMSPLRPGVMPLTKSNACNEAEVRSFQTMTPDGIISKKTNNDSPMTADQVSYLENWWAQRSGHKSRRMAFTNAALEFTRMGFSPVDLNILESSKLSFRQLCNLYQFPAQLLNDNEHATYNNMKEAKIALYEDVIIPELHSLRDEFNRALVPSFGNNLYLDIDTSAIAVLQANKKEMAEWLEKCPFITNQDKQRMMGVTEDPEFPKYTLPSNLVPLDDVGEDLVNQAREQLAGKGLNDYE